VKEGECDETEMTSIHQGGGMMDGWQRPVTMNQPRLRLIDLTTVGDGFSLGDRTECGD
jgi:hypothetical protein